MGYNSYMVHMGVKASKGMASSIYFCIHVHMFWKIIMEHNKSDGLKSTMLKIHVDSLC